MKKNNAIALLLSLCLLLSACGSVGSVSGRTLSNRKMEQNINHLSSDISSSSSSQDATVSSSSPASSGGASGSPPSSAAQQPPVSSSSAPQQRASVNVTIVPGDCIPQIAQKLQDSQVCSKSDFLSTVNSYDFSYYSLVSKIPYEPSKRCYKLEGYLYPDTYTFYVNMKPQDAIGKMLQNAENKIGSKYSYPGMTTDQLITLASIIEKEAPDLANMRKVSDVFHNRLDPANKFYYLDSEATRDYAKILGTVSNDLMEKYKYTYTTSPVNGEARAKGLPAGPICSPGASALSAAANPDTSNFYLYFYSDKNHQYHFSATGNG